MKREVGGDFQSQLGILELVADFLAQGYDLVTLFAVDIRFDIANESDLIHEAFHLGYPGIDLRVSVDFLTYLTKTGGVYRLDPKMLINLDALIENILERKMVVILDFIYFIPDDKFSFVSDEERRQHEAEFLAVWRILAERYRDYPAHLYFELANEPHKPITPEVWNRYVREALAEIRSSGGNNRDRMVVVGTDIRINRRNTSWDDVNGVTQLKLPSVEEAPNIMVTFHYYRPTLFTFQGMDFSDSMRRHSQEWVGNMWDNTERQRAMVERDFDTVSKWAAKSGRKVILGEFGVTTKADIVSQVNWTRFVREEAESRGMVWILWQLFDGVQGGDTVGAIYNNSMGFFRKEILDALIPGDKSGISMNAGDASSVVFSEQDRLWARKEIEALQNPEWKVRERAVAALRTAKPAAALAVPALAKVLADEEWQVRRRAAEALAAIGPAASRVQRPGRQPGI